MSPYYIQPQPASREATAEYAYPYMFNCIQVVVPLDTGKVPVLWLVMKNGHVQALLPVMLLFIAARLFVQKRTLGSDLHAIWFRTIGICMAQIDIGKSSNRLEMLWTIGLLIFSIIASATLGGIIYTKLVIVQTISNIDTLDELAKSNLKIFVVDFIYVIGEWTSFVRLA